MATSRAVIVSHILIVLMFLIPVAGILYSVGTINDAIRVKIYALTAVVFSNIAVFFVVRGLSLYKLKIKEEEEDVKTSELYHTIDVAETY